MNALPEVTCLCHVTPAPMFVLLRMPKADSGNSAVLAQLDSAAQLFSYTRS
jgi:hypothetical protein